MMQEPDASAAWLDPVVEAYRRERPLLLVFDYDGTLSPIVRHPSLAVLPTATGDLLARFAVLPRVTLAVVSGRAIEDVRKLVPVPGCYYAGSGGLEMDLLGERLRYQPPAGLDDTFAAAKEKLAEPLRRHPNAWVEQKPGTVSIHFRGLLPLDAVCFRNEVAEQLAAFPQLHFREVSEAFEVAPAGGWNKGTAVEMLLDRVRRRHPESPLPIYFGDSPNDEEGMSASVLAGGFAVGVGSDAPDVAVHRVTDPGVLAGQLATLYRRVAPSASATSSPESFDTGDDDDEADRPIQFDSSGLIVVDSDADHRDRLSRELRRHGWRVWSFGSAGEADQALTARADEVRAVLVDLDQPGLAGGRLLAKWGQNYPAVVRCGMAGVSPYMASAFRRACGLPLLAKPVDPDESNQQLRRLLADASATYPIG